MNAKLVQKIEKYKGMTREELAEKFKCQPEEICMDDYVARNTHDKVCPYKVILGFANFEMSNVEDLGNLEIIFGRKLKNECGDISDIKRVPLYLGLNLKNSNIKNLGKLRKVYGQIFFNKEIVSLDNIEFLGSNLYVSNTNIVSLGNLRIIDGVLRIADDPKSSTLTSLESLEKVRYLDIDTKTMFDIGELQEIKKYKVSLRSNPSIKEMLERNFFINENNFIKKDNMIKN